MITASSPVGQLHPPITTPKPDSLLKAEADKLSTMNQIVVSLMQGSEDRHKTDAEKISLCSQDAYVSSDGTVKSYGRCNKRLCATCSKARASEWHKIMCALPDHLAVDLYDEEERSGLPTVAGLALTLNAGQALPITHLKSILKILHKLWPRLLKSSALKRNLSGAIRATEITVDMDDIQSTKANPHIHGLILLKIPSDTDNLSNWLSNVASDISKWWRRSIKRELKQLLKLASPEVTSSAQSITPLYSHNRTNFKRWGSYITKGAIHSLATQLRSEAKTKSLIELTQVWLEIDKAVRGARLISAQGCIKDALSDAKIDAKASSRPSSPDGEESKPRITHKWSYTLDCYLSVQDWNVDHKRPSDWLSRRSHLLPSPHYAPLKVRAYAREQLERQESMRQAVLHNLSTGDTLDHKQGHLADS